MSQVTRLALVLIAFSVSIAHAQSTQPSSEPTTAPAKVSTSAQALLDQLNAAYSKSNAFQFDGRFTFDLDAAGQKDHRQLDFTSSFLAPNLFRHEMKGDLLIASTGTALFAQLVDRNQYMTFDAPKSRSADELAPSVRDMLIEQNPALLLAISGAPAATIVDGAKSVDRIDDSEIDHQKCPTLKIVEDGDDMTLALDGGTGLIRRVSIDFHRTLEDKNVPQIKSSLATIDYLKVSSDAKLDSAAFAWTPPKGVTLVKPDAPDEVAGGSGGAGEDAAATQLVGKPAPNFKLQDIHGQKVSLADLKGKAVVLDFWASWCPPCRESLPHMNELARTRAAEGVRVFAVNLSEGMEKASAFATENKLADLTVLVDGDGAVAAKFFVSPIPQTVVIDKNGVVRKVIIGYGPGVDETLSAAVTAALK